MELQPGQHHVPW